LKLLDIFGLEPFPSSPLSSLPFRSLIPSSLIPSPLIPQFIDLPQNTPETVHRPSPDLLGELTALRQALANWGRTPEWEKGREIADRERKERKDKGEREGTNLQFMPLI